ncbi:MAG: recombinase family protein [Candidatus Ornithomonoglobus sp.]
MSDTRTAAAYIRVSTDEQIEFSPDSQLARIREYSKRNNIILPQEFIFMDEGISGRKAEKRPQFMRMIGLAKQKPKPFDVILLWKFSRFARNREDSIVYKSMLRKQCGIDVVSITENIGDDKMSVLIEALIEAMDEFYSVNLSEEVKRGMTEKAKRGGVLSSPAYGYKVENGQYVIVPEEAEVIRTVFRRYNEGTGMLRIAKDLNAIGIRTHRGSRIENRTVEYWLNNPVYIGKIRWTPSGKTSRNYHNPDSMITDGEHEPIIDNETWELTQKLMKEQKEKYRPYYKPMGSISHWLVSLARCGVCGGPLVNCSGYFYCNNRNKGVCPGNGGISVKKLNNIVLEQLHQVMDSSTYLSAPIKKAKPRYKDNNSLIEQQIQKAYTRLERVKEAYEHGIDTIEEYKINKQRITAEIAKMEAETKTESETTPEEDLYKLQNSIRAAIDALESDAASPKEKNEIANGFIAEINKTGLDGKEFDIFYRI